MRSTQVLVRDLRRAYSVGEGEVLALRGVDLEVPRGEFLGIVGVSGSGKSTLLHLIGGLDSPTSGVVRVEGHDLSRMDSLKRSLYRRNVVGFVFQSFHLVPALTAKGNLTIALTFQGTYGKERDRRAEEALERVGLKERMHHRPSQLSGGEQQRVTVARAIVHRPRLLLADEPTGNLDRQTATDLMELLSKINREFETTIIMVTHDRMLAERCCDRIIEMQDGRVGDSM